MTSKNPLLILGAGALAYAAYKAYSLNRASDLFTYGVSNLKLGRFDGSTLNVLGNFTIDNPSRQTVRFSGFAGNLLYGNINLGKIYTDPKSNPFIKALGTSKISFQSKISILASVDLALLAKGGKLKKPLLVKGVLYLGDVQIPVEQEIALS